MFDKDIDQRLSAWAEFRKSLETSQSPFKDVVDFWRDAPFIPYNNAVDPFFRYSWPSPWDIIVHNKYDDFTKALMIGWTLKLTDRFKSSAIELRTYVDKKNLLPYNIICVDNQWAINYKDNEPVEIEKIPDWFNMENLVELTGLR